METTLGSVISRKRQELDLTQRELAKKIGISNSTIARIEKDEGNIRPDTATLQAIAQALHLDYNYLLALSNQVDDEPEIRIIQRAAKKMSSEDKERMLQMLSLMFTEQFKNAGTDEDNK